MISHFLTHTRLHYSGYSSVSRGLAYLMIISLMVNLAACVDSPAFLSSPAQSNEASNDLYLETSTPAEVFRFATFDKNLTPTLSPTEVIPQPATSTATPTVNARPSLASDLLFLSENRLVRWDYLTNFTTPLVEGVSDYAASKDARRIALLRQMKIAANGVALYNLDLLDMESKQVSSLLKGYPRLNELTISPNGVWVSYLSGQDQNQPIYVLNTLKEDQPQQIGICNPSASVPCKIIGWSPDNFSLVWEDQQGLWMSKMAKNQPALLSGHQLEVIDPKGHKSTVNVSFNSLSWLPGSRYLMAQATTEAGVCWYAILDTYQLTWTEAPGTFASECPAQASVGWTEDGIIRVVDLAQQSNSPMVTVASWKIVPTRPGLFELVNKIELTHLPLIAGQATSENSKWITLWPGEVGQDTIGFSLGKAIPETGIAFYLVDLDQEQLSLISEYPDQASGALWAPDESGVLVINSPAQAQFIPIHRKGLVDLSVLACTDCRKFTWTPPAPRS
jgi:hypothetical protein